MPTRISRALAGAAATLAVVLAIPAANAGPHVEVGVLDCKVEGGTGFIIGSSKRLNCRFTRPGRDEHYTGVITKFGVDLGTTTTGVISWAVMAPSVEIPVGALQGSYGGVTGEATIGLGVGANALVGGSLKTLALQPLSVSAQQGLNLAAGIAALELTPGHGGR